MENLDEFNFVSIKKEQICRTCLTNDGHFFNISDIFDTFTLAQMIQDITNLQMNHLDGYTQSICFECVRDLRNANKFRIKCLESNNVLIKVETKTEVPVNIYEIDLPKIEEIKQEADERSNSKDDLLNTDDDCKPEDPAVESDYENNEDVYESKEQNFEDNRNESKKCPTLIFDCPLCHGLFSSDNIYQKHINELHPDRLNDGCFNQKREPLGYIVKKKYSKNLKNLYKCALDDFFANSFVEFKNHRKEHTGEKSVICAECGFRTSDIFLLKKHTVQKHLEEKKFSCSLCDYSCQTHKALKSHSAIHTLEKNYQCKQCPMTFKFQSGLSAHKKEIHEKRKPHVCLICQKAFFRSTRLRDHMRTHTGERPHICHYCGMGFARAENMKTHVTLQHEPIKTMFKCDKCDYSTKHKTEFKNHTRRHNGEKPFKCPQCPFSSLLKYALKLHIMRHAGEKKFECDLCDYKAMSPGVIKIHRRIHTGEKPYSCTMCSYSGRTAHEFKRHTQTHSTEQKFECPNCPFKTNVRVNLSRHLKKNCIIKKRGRPASKLSYIPEDDEIKEDTEGSIGYYQTT